MKTGAGVAVFILFFGLAFFQAIAERNWFFAGVFLFLAVLSLYADNIRREQ